MNSLKNTLPCSHLIPQTGNRHKLVDKNCRNLYLASQRCLIEPGIIYEIYLLSLIEPNRILEMKNKLESFSNV